jgi:hypothetical protein
MKKLFIIRVTKKDGSMVIYSAKNKVNATSLQKRELKNNENKYVQVEQI